LLDRARLSAVKCRSFVAVLEDVLIDARIHPYEYREVDQSHTVNFCFAPDTMYSSAASALSRLHAAGRSGVIFASSAVSSATLVRREAITASRTRLSSSKTVTRIIKSEF